MKAIEWNTLPVASELKVLEAGQIRVYTLAFHKTEIHIAIHVKKHRPANYLNHSSQQFQVSRVVYYDVKTPYCDGGTLR